MLFCDIVYFLRTKIYYLRCYKKLAEFSVKIVGASRGKLDSVIDILSGRTGILLRAGIFGKTDDVIPLSGKIVRSALGQLVTL